MYEAEFELEAELEDLMAVLGESDLQSEAQHFAPFDMLRSYRDRAIVADLIARGVRNENQVTDAVFFDHHPERNGRRLASSETALIREWYAIRDQLVLPALRQGAGPQGPPAPSGGTPATTGNVRDADVRFAQQIATRPVPGMPGVNIQQLIEGHRSQRAPEIPMPLLLAFLRYESGGNFNDSTHGVLVGLDEKGRRVRPGQKPVRFIRSPEFYELGLFQTPAGLHGCTPTEPTQCQYPPPGREIPGNLSEWVKLCTSIGANPDHWQDPSTQVQVGLLNLENAAQAIRARNRDLFSVPGNDWDLHAAVLLPFAGGGGYTQNLLNLYRAQLARLPEDQRWAFLRNKMIAQGAGSYDYKIADNVDKKMSLAAKLGYGP